MPVAAWLIEAADQLRRMARYYTDESNDIHLLTHGAITWLLRRPGVFEAPISHADLAAALCASAHGLARGEGAWAEMTPRVGETQVEHRFEF